MSFQNSKEPSRHFFCLRCFAKFARLEHLLLGLHRCMGVGCRVCFERKWLQWFFVKKSRPCMKGVVILLCVSSGNSFGGALAFAGPGCGLQIAHRALVESHRIYILVPTLHTCDECLSTT
eukprot:Blabericola_migrator_1__5078@NODE_2629_length_2514_cov_84_416428_g1649_i0_p3_GENE_NODE_2629_length_2514_cov_84_416428_g1649_i0NODE_2629_length_2514_cov_84_416428_g1649_i0_p3_ORF_typecomplete_len120_score2_96_NODE_2629_length_2514_cov_84_416428_g1649_i0302661